MQSHIPRTVTVTTGGGVGDEGTGGASAFLVVERVFLKQQES